MSEYLLHNENEALEKSLCVDSMESRASYFAFKALCCILGHFLCQAQNKEHFLETDGKFQSTGNRTEKISTFHLVLGGYQLEVGTWDCECCSAGGLGHVAIGQMSLLQTHRSSWQTGWRFVC